MLSSYSRLRIVDKIVPSDNQPSRPGDPGRYAANLEALIMFGFLKRLLGARPQNSFGYSPVIGGARTVRQFAIGDFNADLMTDIKSTGSVEYTHILAVYGSDGKPVFFTAAEVNSVAEQFGGGSHYLGVFDGTGHASISDNDKWADLEIFEKESVMVVKEHFGIAD